MEKKAQIPGETGVCCRVRSAQRSGCWPTRAVCPACLSGVAV